MLASQSKKIRRKDAAIKLINNLRVANSAFVSQAETISTEIQRVAILQQEEWLEYMEEACRYHKEQQFEKISQLMYPLHYNFVKSNPDSHNEILFYQKYSYRINEALGYLKNYNERRVPGFFFSHESNSLHASSFCMNTMAVHAVIAIYNELIQEMRKEMESMSTVGPELPDPDQVGQLQADEHQGQPSVHPWYLRSETATDFHLRILRGPHSDQLEEETQEDQNIRQRWKEL